MIGDRASRDGEAARRAGVRALIRSRWPQGAVQTFGSYADELFQTVSSPPRPAMDGLRTSPADAIPPPRSSA
jgi:hypothetical protein